MAFRLRLLQFTAYRSTNTISNGCWKVMAAAAEVAFSTCRRYCSVMSPHELTEEHESDDEANEKTRPYCVADFPGLVVDKITKERLRLLLRQHKLRLRHGLPTPLELSSQDVLDLLAKDSFNKRCRLFKYLFHQEQKRLRQQRRETDGLVTAEVPKPTLGRLLPHSADRLDEYRLFRNSFLLRIRDRAVNRFYESRQIPAVLFGQSVVFDLSYDEVMTPRECNKAARDLLSVFGRNRWSRDPFHLYFCNASPNGLTTRILQSALFEASEIPLLSELTPSSYLNIFPKEKLVYLTPDSENTLDVFDYDAVYVVGALVDKEAKKGATLAKATSEGLKTVRFPQTFAWYWQKEVPQPLHLIDVFKILLALKCTNDWNSALRFVNRSVTVQQD
uniref:RNA (guanine-9-)-methyltransferase domain-containing protein 1 n=1 Tax=Amblyomma aureolatum TaxID=187763 RepID=A0A1E1XBW5_9ACAR